MVKRVSCMTSCVVRKRIFHVNQPAFSLLNLQYVLTVDSLTLFPNAWHSAGKHSCTQKQNLSPHTLHATRLLKRKWPLFEVKWTSWDRKRGGDKVCVDRSVKKRTSVVLAWSELSNILHKPQTTCTMHTEYTNTPTNKVVQGCPMIRYMWTLTPCDRNRLKPAELRKDKTDLKTDEFVSGMTWFPQ